jgi:hypothetical protein
MYGPYAPDSRKFYITHTPPASEGGRVVVHSKDEYSVLARKPGSTIPPPSPLLNQEGAPARECWTRTIYFNTPFVYVLLQQN